MENASDISMLTAADLLAADLPARAEVLAPLLACDTAALVYGPTGIGKSFFVLGIAWAVASGGSFLGWQAPRPRRVLYVDGELGAAELRERLILFGPPPERLMISAHGLGSGPLLDLSQYDGMARLMAAWDQPELVVLDALSTLTGLGSGDPERWDRVQRFLLHQREHQRAVLMVHHANKQGELHGTSRRSNALDLVMALRRPQEEVVCGDARFEVHFEKTRRRHPGRGGAPLAPVRAELETNEAGHARWRWGPVAGGRLERAAALFNRGLGEREAAGLLGISRASLYRLKAKARAQGLVKPTGEKS
jgi:putative DNA primase/helicase